jgi:predicted ATP-grasp superfamily ATP-dependent carboligase
VWVLYDEHRLACLSRYAQRSFAWPTDRTETEQIAYLLRLAATFQLDGWVLFPTGDETAALVARHHEQLSQHFRLTTPPWRTLRWAYDKRLTYRLAARLGIDYPWTRYPRDRADVAELACPFPVIVKPAIKPQANALTVAKAWRANDQRELLERYDAACALLDPKLLMIQEMIPGGGQQQLSVAALCVAGQPLARIVARRVRQYPMDFGRASTYVETIADATLEATAARMLGAIGYSGLVEVEFKRDPRDGRPKLIDMNPRVWGWHTLGQRAGTDFAHLQWRLSHGELPPSMVARAGVRWVRLTTDVPTAVREGARGKLSAGDYIRSLRGPLEFATLAADDPLPALLEVPLLAYLATSRAIAQRTRGLTSFRKRGAAQSATS